MGQAKPFNKMTIDEIAAWALKAWKYALSANGTDLQTKAREAFDALRDNATEAGYAIGVHKDEQGVTVTTGTKAKRVRLDPSGPNNKL